MVEKAKRSFLKAQDLVEIVASPDMQAIFVRKGITKLAISDKTALHWLEKLGWTYGKLKNSMYSILTGTRGRMWWNIGKCLWNVGWDMSDDSIDGTTMGTNSYAQMDSQSLVQSDAFTSSWSHMTNPHFSRTTSAIQDGSTRAASQNQG